jgi:hypothetical protein
MRIGRGRPMCLPHAMPILRRTYQSCSERDSSGTTEQTRSGCEGDGADSPTQAHRRCAKRLAQRNFASQNSMKNEE